MSDRVTVLSTTARSFYSDWAENFFKAGLSKESGYEVRRFPVGARNAEAFERLNAELLGTPRTEWSGLNGRRAETNAFIDESINSPKLEEHLRKAASAYDAVVFIPYLYGVVVRGIEAYPGRAHLIPCLHDEAYVRLPRIEDAIHRAGTLLFNSEGEAELALRIYGPGVIHKSRVIGEGVTWSNAVASSHAIDGGYFLFIGRRDALKGVDFLIEAFSRYRHRAASSYSLVLAGPGTSSYHDPGNGIIDLGFVDDGTKQTLIKQARALVQPSLNESYSRVIMEAWREKVPVVANAECLATAMAVGRSGGGFVAGNIDGWCDAFARLETATTEERDQLGERGCAYAAAHAEWRQVIKRFRDATGLSSQTVPARRKRRLDQVVPALAYGDAVSDYTRFLRRHLLGQGYESSIYARYIDPRVASEAEVVSKKAVASADAVLYHHSIAFDEIDAVLAAAVPKALIYHNITPAHFFRAYDPVFADFLERGRTQLSQLNGAFEECAADSEFNAQELRELGFRNVRVVPISVDFTRFDVTPGPIREARVGGRWLSVGRISASKGIRRLIESFEAFAALDSSARLVLAGAYDPADRYYQSLSKLVYERGLESHVEFAGSVNEATLTAHYRNADIYICLSEHEGFCIPLVEAMFFDLPIIANAGTAIVETLGSAGLLVTPEADPFEIAVIAREMCSNVKLRADILASQRLRRVEFLPERVLPLADAFLAEII